MRTLLVILISLAALIAGAVLALPALFSSDWLRERVSAEAGEMINREVRLSGDVSVAAGTAAHSGPRSGRVHRERAGLWR